MMNTILTIKMPASVPVSETRDHYSRSSRAYGSAKYPEFRAQAEPGPTARDQANGNGGGTTYADKFTAEGPTGERFEIDCADLLDLRRHAQSGVKVGEPCQVRCWVD